MVGRPSQELRANSAINVNSGGVFSASDTSFGEKQLAFNSGSNDTLHFTTVTGHITINSGATINISGNDFSGVGSEGVIAAGVSTAMIDLEENYWGSTDSTTIEKLIDDHHVSSSLPTIEFNPVWATNNGTIATPETVYFSPDDQTFNLSATVSTTGGIPITGGTETFTILNGTQMIGQTTSARGGRERDGLGLLHAAGRYGDWIIHDRGRIQRLRRLPGFDRHEPDPDGEQGSRQPGGDHERASRPGRGNAGDRSPCSLKTPMAIPGPLRAFRRPSA